MKWLIVLFSLIFLTVGAHAQSASIDISNMSAEQQQALKTMAEQLTANKSEPSAILEAIKSINVNKETVSSWAQAGTEAGKAVTNFTTEIKVPAKEFIDSFVGKAIFLIAFMNYGGGKLASFVLDIIIFAVVTPVFLVFINKVFRRFVLHQVPDNGKAWITARKDEEGEEALISERGETIVTVNFGEAVAGWVFIMFSTMFYFGQMWPQWPA